MKKEESKNLELREDGSENQARKAKNEKQLEEAQKKGKIEVAPSKDKRQEEENVFGAVAGQKGKKGKKPKEQSNEIVYEDESSLALDYESVNKFGRLGLSPPTDVEQLPQTEKELIQLRDSLKIKGELEQVEAKAKFLHDDKLLEDEDYVGKKEIYDGYEEKLKKRLDAIRHEVRFGRDV